MTNNYIDINEARKRKGISLRHAYRLVEEGTWKAIKQDGRIKIDITCDERLVRKDMPQNMLNSNELNDVPGTKRQEALQRLGLIERFEAFAATYKSRSLAVEFFVRENNISRGSLYRWLTRYHNQGLVGLIDTRGGSRFIKQIISEDAFEFFKTMYLTQQRLSVKTCWLNINYINKSENRGWKIPSLMYMYKFIKSQIPLGVQVLHREGIRAYEAKCAPHIQIDPDSVGPGAIWVGDHSQLNCWIRHRNRWIRPWLTAWQDMRSRAILGFFVSPNPNQTTILQAFKRAVLKYGPPDVVKVDNGRDYDSESWTGTTKVRRRALRKGYIDEQLVAGIYAMLDIAVSFAIPYRPKSKPIERFFDTLDCQFTKTISTYCGKDAERKPEELNKLLQSEKTISQAYDINSVAEQLEEYIEIYNNSAHTGLGMNNRTPMQVFASRESRRVLAEGVIDLIARVWSGELTIGKNGVRFKGMYYGQYNTELLIHQGKKVRISYDPDDLRQIYVYNSTTFKLITIAEQNQLVLYGQAVDEENLREAMRQQSRARKTIKNFVDSSLTANTDLTALTLKAMREAAKQETGGPSKEMPGQTIRPVRTPLDDQVREHQRQEIIKHVRRASGAESITTVLDLDFSLLKETRKKTDLKLFDK